MQYINTAYGKEAREKETGQAEQEEKMAFRLNKRRVVVAVKGKHKLGAGEEMRVAYGWTKATWTGITEADKDEAAHEAAHPAQMATPVEPKEEMASQHQATWLGEAQQGGGTTRGWVTGDRRDIQYRGRIGAEYQAHMEEGEERVGEQVERGAVRLSEKDLWSDTRLGNWRKGEGAEDIHARMEERRKRGKGDSREESKDTHAEEEIGDKEEAETEDTGKAEGEEECWLHPDWIVGQTVEEVNRQWERHKRAGWWRGKEPKESGESGREDGKEAAEVEAVLEAEAEAGAGHTEDTEAARVEETEETGTEGTRTEEGGDGQGGEDREAAATAEQRKRQRPEESGEEEEEEWVQCTLGNVRVVTSKRRGEAGGRVVRLAELVAGRRRKRTRKHESETVRRGRLLQVFQGSSEGEERGSCAATEDAGEDKERKRGARECDEAMMEATEARRGYTKAAAWDEGNMIQAMARLKNPTIAWRYGDG